jgi:tetratricopeptide (TPR) repeat protein
MQLFPARNPAFAFLISLIFMAHPIHTEVVANIKSRDEILSFLNTFIALNLAFRYSLTKSRKDLIWSIVFFYLALLSKETAVVGLALIPLFLFYSGLKIPEVLKRSIPYAGAAILFFMQKRYFLGGNTARIPNDIINYPYVDSSVKLPSVFHIFWLCLQKLIYPLPLSYDYSYNQIPASHWSDIGAILGLLSFLALAFVALRGILKRSIWSLGLAILFITIAPSLGFVFLRGGILAERFLYAPCLGFALILVYALSLISKQKKDRAVKLFEWIKTNAIATGVVLALCSFYSVATVQRNPAWKNNLTLFGTDANHSTKSAQVHRHYGTALVEAAAIEKDTAKRRELDVKGISELQKAIAIDSEFGEAYCEIGYAYQGVYLVNDSAVKYFRKAIETAPGLVTSYNNLGVIYQNTGRLKLASYYYNKALEVNPHYPDAIQHAADLKKSTGLDVHEMPEEVDNHNAKVVKTITSNVASNSPKDIEFNNYFNQGAALVSKGDYEAAIPYLQKAETLKPEHEQTMLELANCYGLTKRYQLGINMCKKILRYYPNDLAVMGNLAVTYQAAGQNAKADSVRAEINKRK